MPADSGGILFYGDPHGEWQNLLRAVADLRPAAIILLGDLDLEVPLRRQLAGIFAAGVPIAWIHGNHDLGSPEAYDHLWGDHPGGALHVRTMPLGGLRVAGLGGIFRGRAWFPKHGDEPPRFPSRADFLAAHPSAQAWRDTIFRDDLAGLHGQRADILVTHEAPTSHSHGFGALDDLARDLGARLVVHGHHHVSYSGMTRDGIAVRGLGKAEPWLLERDDCRWNHRRSESRDQTKC